MIRFFNKTKGSISIFLILVLVPMYTCVYLAIDSVRYSAAKDKALGAMQLTGNSALSDYDKTFKELYGLFVMSKSEGELKQNLISYYSNMVDNEFYLGGTTLAREAIENLVDTTFENTINTKVEDLTVEYDSPIYDTKTLSDSIRNFMKYRAPYNWANGTLQKVSAFKQTDKVSTVIDGSKEYYKSISTVESELNGIYLAIQKVKDLNDNSDVLKALNNIKSTLPSIKSSISNSNAKAEKWESTIGNLEEGEAKKLLTGEYKNSAASITEKSISEFENVLSEDINKLNNAIKAEKSDENEEAGEIELNFSKTDFYSYLVSSYGNISSAEESAKQQKEAMEAIASTDLTSVCGDITDVDIGSLLSEKTFRTISEHAGDSGISLSGFSKLGDLALNSYEMEYIISMFGCLTTKESDKNLMNSTFGSRPILKGEVEYILFGKNNLASNIALTLELIFAVRLIMNSIYVYTNTNMRQSALAVATAIAGWTGIGIPVAQNAILVAWATAESILDVASLSKGKSVPIYKTASTWTLSLQNIPGTLAKGASNYASKGIDDIFERIESASVEKTEDIKDATISFLNQSTQGAVESLTSMVVTPVERTVTTMTSGVKTNFTRSEIENAILSAVNSVDISSSGARAAKEIFVNDCMGYLVDTVYNSLPSIFTNDESLASQARNAISNAINDTYSKMFSKLENVVDSYAKKAEDTLSSSLSSANEKVKTKTINIINEYTKSLSEFIGNTSEGSISTYSGMGMTYQDYLRIFALIGLSTKNGKESLLKRCAIVMQIDCDNKSKGFNITECFVSVRLSTVTAVNDHIIKLSEVYRY